MFVTKKKHTEAIKHLEWVLEWHKDRHSSLQDDLWQLKRRHEELLAHLNLTQNPVDAHYETKPK